MNLIKTLSLIAAIAAFNVAYAADAASACACPAKDGKACECTKDGKACGCPKDGKACGSEKMGKGKGQCGPMQGGKEGCTKGSCAKGAAAPQAQ